MKKVYGFFVEPAFMEYDALIRYTCEHSDAVMWVHETKIGSKIENAIKREMREVLAEWRIKTRNTPHWPVTRIGEAVDYRYSIDVYKISDEIQDFLLSSVIRMYDWGKGYLPEDISFFKNHECWFATCSHEEFGWLNTDLKLPKQFNSFLRLTPNPNDVSYTEDYPLEDGREDVK